MKRIALFATLLLVAACSACSKKDDAAQPVPGASASAAASAPQAPEPEPSPVPDPIKAASTATAPAEPNAPPPHDEHERAAAAEVHKGNYKDQLEALEKEDLSADRNP